MKLTIGCKSYTVATIEEASRLYGELRDKSGKGASKWPEGKIETEDGTVYRVSYNGRVWTNEERWQDRTVVCESAR